MVTWSQLHHRIDGLSCNEVTHPWAKSCIAATAGTWLEGIIGSASFFGVFYLIQYLSRVVKKKSKMKVKDILWMHLRSTFFGGAVSSLTFGSHCVLRNLLGRFTFLTTVFLPAFIGGQSIYLENRKAREIFTNAFANCTLEIGLKLLERSNVLRWNPNIQTVMFMILSSVVSSMLSSTNFDSTYFWFFTPPRVNKTTDENAACFHEDECRTHMSKLILMYSATGFALQFLKLFFYYYKDPKMILLSLKSPSTFTLAAFLGGYVALYQAIRCFLYQREKKYSLAHDSLAGFLAGVAFRFQPTIPIFNSAIITAVQIFTLIACQKKIIPNLPYLEVMFAFFCGVLFHQRLLGDFCPRLTVYFMSSVTHGLSDRIRARFEDIACGPFFRPGSKPEYREEVSRHEVTYYVIFKQSSIYLIRGIKIDTGVLNNDL